MLLADCQKLTQQAQEVVALKTYAKEVERFRKRQDQIQDLVKELSSLVDSLRAFKVRGIYKFSSSQKTDQLLKELVAISAKYSDDRGFLIGEEFKVPILNSKFKSLTDSLRLELSQVWQDYREEKMPPTNEELLDLLEKIQTFRSTVQQVKRIITFLNSITFPVNIEEFNQADAQVSKLSDAWNSLQSNEVPESVLNFLKATSTLGASLDSLTPEVEAWLRDKKITHLFQIKLSA